MNGPLANACIQTLKNEGNFKVTGKLSVEISQGEGELEYEEFDEISGKIILEVIGYV